MTIIGTPELTDKPWIHIGGGRGGGIRTLDLLVPNQALYQAEPLPEDSLLTLSLKQLLRRNAYDSAVAPDDNGVTASGMILNGFRHGFLQGLLGFDADEMNTSL